MKVLSITVEYKGVPIKISDEKVFVQVFGMHALSQGTPHWFWLEIKKEKMSDELKKYLEEEGLL